VEIGARKWCPSRCKRHKHLLLPHRSIMASSTTPLKYNEGAALPQDAPDWAVSASERLKQRHKQGGVGTAAIPPRGSKRVLLHSCCAPCSGAMVEGMCSSLMHHYSPFLPIITHHFHRNVRLRAHWRNSGLFL
jgi:hypothetical protein